MERTLVEIKDLKKGFPIRGGVFGREIGRVHAVRGVSLSIRKGEVLGLVGESGCGKSTLGMLMLRLVDSDSGKIIFDGTDITAVSQPRLRRLRQRMQIIFQDPYASLNPRMKAGEIIAEPLVIHKIGDRAARRARVLDLISKVGLPESAYSKYPHEFSGGQRQRIGIARAIAMNPDFVIADEPVSALDVSIRGEILNLLSDLRNSLSLTYLFISHDLKVVEHISDRVAVMYLGKIVELFPSEAISQASHPYTRALISAVPVPDPASRRERILLEGDVPSPINPPTGCPFHPRCPHARDICKTEEPSLREYLPGRIGACHFIDEFK